MADRIKVNQAETEKEADVIEGAALYLKNIPLTPQDMRTTLPANAGSINAYNKAQDRIASLGGMLDQEVSNIRSLQAAFTEFDEMTGLLEKNRSAL